MEKEHICGLCIVNDNKVLFVNKENKLSFPVVSYNTYKYTDSLQNYGLNQIEISKNLGTYEIGENFQVEVFSFITEVKDEKKYKQLLDDENMLFIDINMIEDFLASHITLDTSRNQVDQMILKSINAFRGVEEVPKQMKLVLTEE